MRRATCIGVLHILPNPADASTVIAGSSRKISPNAFVLFLHGRAVPGAVVLHRQINCRRNSVRIKMAAQWKACVLTAPACKLSKHARTRNCHRKKGRSQTGPDRLLGPDRLSARSSPAPADPIAARMLAEHYRNCRETHDSGTRDVIRGICRPNDSKSPELATPFPPHPLLLPRQSFFSPQTTTVSHLQHLCLLSRDETKRSMERVGFLNSVK